VNGDADPQNGWYGGVGGVMPPIFSLRVEGMYEYAIAQLDTKPLLWNLFGGKPKKFIKQSIAEI
jgi:hypothetical protein